MTSTRSGCDWQQLTVGQYVRSVADFIGQIVRVGSTNIHIHWFDYGIENKPGGYRYWYVDFPGFVHPISEVEAMLELLTREIRI